MRDDQMRAHPDQVTSVIVQEAPDRPDTHAARSAGQVELPAAEPDVMQ